MKKLIALCALLTAALSTQAQSISPAGFWKTIDDDSGKATSIVEIKIEDGELKGTIVKLLDPEDAGSLCEECDGDKKNQPIEGLEFIWGLTEEDGVWDEGNILDPKDGTVYSSKIEVIDGGAKLDVRGYVGFAFAGRSQVWQRSEAPAAQPAVSVETASANAAAK